MFDSLHVSTRREARPITAIRNPTLGNGDRLHRRHRLGPAFDLYAVRLAQRSTAEDTLTGGPADTLPFDQARVAAAPLGEDALGMATRATLAERIKTFTQTRSAVHAVDLPQPIENQDGAG